jgi:AAA family ATP:ADP antiporter
MMENGTQPAERRSLLARVFSTLTAVERREMPVVLVAFFLFFCVLGGYFAVRPVRETVGTILGRDRVANLWLATWIVSLAIVPIYGAIVAKIRRSVFLPLIYGFVAVALAIVGAVLQANPRSVAVAQFFYVFISVLSLFLVSVFWSFMVELFDSGQAKRLFPVIAAGGTAGALAGPLFTDLTARSLGNGGILFVGAGMFGVAVMLQAILIRLWKREPELRRDGSETAGQPRDRALGGNPFAGVTLVLRSPYLLGIAAYVTLLATANTFLYFEQLRLVETTFQDPQTRTSVFARIDWIVQSLTILAQLFITGRVASRLGVVVLLTIIPVAIFFGFVALAIWNSFAVLASRRRHSLDGERMVARPPP